MSENIPEEKHFCRNCRGERNHKVLFKKSVRNEDLMFYNISFLLVYGNEYTYDELPDGSFKYYDIKRIYPEYLEDGSEIIEVNYLPEPIRSIYQETITAIKSNLSILVAAGYRAIIEAICNYLKIKKAPLKERIDLLSEERYLSPIEAKRLHPIRIHGNEAVHDIEKITYAQTIIILEIVNHLLMNLFIHDKITKGFFISPVDKYEDFKKLIYWSITDSKVGKTFTINQLLGNYNELIIRKKHKEFIGIFNKEVLDGKHDYVELISENKIERYKVVKLPVPNKEWDIEDIHLRDKYNKNVN